MNLNEYQKQASRTRGADHGSVKNGCLGLIGESGEIVDIVKKWMFQSGENAPLPVDSIINEAGDMLWYCAETASGLHVPLEDLVERVCDFANEGEIGDIDLEGTAVSLSRNAIMAYFAFFEYHNPSMLMYAVRDIYALLLHLCELTSATIEHVAKTNIAKLKARYPDGFDPERSLHRQDHGQTGKADKESGSPSSFLFDMRNQTV